MNILMTGESGFVGSHLISQLESSKHTIYHLTRKAIGKNREFVWNFVDPLPDTLPSCNIIIHLAACVNFRTDFNPEIYLVNTGSVAHLASYAKKHNAHIIFASTAGIHGNAEYIDQKTPVILTNDYTVSKYLAELIIQSQLTKYSILRISGIYGLDGPSHLGLNKAISDAFYKNKAPTLHGPGTMKRNYIGVSDVVHWIQYLITQLEDARTDIQEVLYLAGPETLSIREYLEMITAKLLKNVPPIQTKKGEKGRDIVIKASPFPVALTTFSLYLDQLIKSRKTPRRSSG